MLGLFHILLVGDLRQLPPATNRPPFIVDPLIFQLFEFRVLRQNRRLAEGADPADQAALEDFHATLDDVAENRCSQRVHDQILAAYVRGARCTQENVPFEGHTAVLATRRFRNRWNKAVLRRSAARHGRGLRVKASFLAQASRDRFLSDAAANVIQRDVRLQSLVRLQLAGQWLQDPPREEGAVRPHCMRGMLVANLHVENGFANGSLVRVVHWGPDASITGIIAKSCLADVPGVQVRVCHEEAVKSNRTHYIWAHVSAGGGKSSTTTVVYRIT